MKLCQSFLHVVAALLQMQNVEVEISTNHCSQHSDRETMRSWDSRADNSEAKLCTFFQRETGLWAGRRKVSKQGSVVIIFF